MFQLQNLLNVIKNAINITELNKYISPKSGNIEQYVITTVQIKQKNILRYEGTSQNGKWEIQEEKLKYFLK